MKYDLVQIDWVDITKTFTGWVSEEDVLEQADFMVCHSVGFLIHKSPTRVIICQSHSSSADMLTDPLVIPTQVIRKISVLTERKEK